MTPRIPPDDGRPICQCAACGYLGYCEPVPLPLRPGAGWRPRRAMVCEPCRGVPERAAAVIPARKPPARAGVRIAKTRKAGAQ